MAQRNHEKLYSSWINYIEFYILIPEIISVVGMYIVASYYYLTAIFPGHFVLQIFLARVIFFSNVFVTNQNKCRKSEVCRNIGLLFSKRLFCKSKHLGQ